MENINLLDLLIGIAPYALIMYLLVLLPMGIYWMWKEQAPAREHAKMYKGIKTTRRKTTTPTTTHTVVILSTNERYRDAQKSNYELMN